MIDSFPMAAPADAAFDLSHRPFRGTPAPEDYVPLESVEGEIRRLAESAARGDGIGVLTAPPGAGKTAVCQRLCAELASRFVAALLSSSGFATRRALLQAILFALGRAYESFSEQELRLSVLNYARGVVSGKDGDDKQGIVLIVDEAHLLNARLLEELRCLTNHSEGGRSLIRVILCGQLSLEETLISPALEAFNYRITCHATLEPLSLQESAKLIAGRLLVAGTTIGKVFRPEAMETICRVSDGNPRCLVQLCDHALSLAPQQGESMVSVETVRIALSRLKQLPMQWNESATDEPSRADCDTFDASPEIEFWIEDSLTPDGGAGDAGELRDPDEMTSWSSAVSSVEVGSSVREDVDSSSTRAWSTFEPGAETDTADDVANECAPGPPVGNDTAARVEPHGPIAEGESGGAGGLIEMDVRDPYAELDRFSGRAQQLPATADLHEPLEPPSAPAPRPGVASRTVDHGVSESVESALTAREIDVEQRIDSIMLALSMVNLGDQKAAEPRREVFSGHESSGDQTESAHLPWRTAGDSRDYDMVEPQMDEPQADWEEERVVDSVPPSLAGYSPLTDDLSLEPQDLALESQGESPVQRPYARLFSRLRRQRT